MGWTDRITGSALYRRRVHQLRASLWMLASAVGQVLAANSLDAIEAWSLKRWILGLGAVFVPAVLLAMRGGEFNAPIALTEEAPKR